MSQQLQENDRHWSPPVDYTVSQFSFLPSKLYDFRKESSLERKGWAGWGDCGKLEVFLVS